MQLKFDIPQSRSSIIKVIGVGGGGSNAVNHMYQQGIKGVDFYVCNTDAQALDLSPIPNKIHIGSNLTEGRGAGSDPEVGKKAAQENIEEIKQVLNDNTKMIFVTAGMGGGTGTGAAPVIAKVAKEMGILTVGIVTIPFTFEGPKRKLRAHEGLENLKKNVDTLLVIENENLREMYGNFPFSAAFAHADDILTTAAKGIAEIITVPGYINVDFEDVKTVMANSGVAIMGSAVAEGEERARKAIEGALDSPLLSANDIQGAEHILLNITSGSKEILLDEITVITNYIQEEAGLYADMIWGHCYDESLGEKIMVTLIATGFDAKQGKYKNEENKTVVSLDSGDNKQVTFIQPTLPIPGILEKPQELKQTQEPDLKSDPVSKSKKKKILEPLKTLDKRFEELENEPAYKRKQVILKSIPHSSENNLSRYTLGDDVDENGSIKPKNSFLHDNVD